jgi:hypothetical protein
VNDNWLLQLAEVCLARTLSIFVYPFPWCHIVMNIITVQKELIIQIWRIRGGDEQAEIGRILFL